jgi:DNA-directed RNA polymerase subunit RPC12/RpoP
MATTRAFCSGCGRAVADCPGGCRRELDPPRFCPDCGKKLFAQVTPQGYRARCKAHGEFDLATLGEQAT